MNRSLERGGKMRAVNLKTEHMVNPIGIDILKPYVSWNYIEGKKQTRNCEAHTLVRFKLGQSGGGTYGDHGIVLVDLVLDGTVVHVLNGIDDVHRDGRKHRAEGILSPLAIANVAAFLKAVENPVASEKCDGCHLELALDRSDLKLGVRLSVADLLLLVLLSLVLHDVDLLVLTLCKNLSSYASTFNGGSACNETVVVRNSINLLKNNLAAFFCAELLDKDDIALGDFVLLSASRNNSKHWKAPLFHYRLAVLRRRF